MAPRETENNAYAKFGVTNKEHYGMLWYFLERSIERFHSRGQHLCKFIGTKESVCIRKDFNSHRIGLEHQHGRRFIVLGHQVAAVTSCENTLHGNFVTKPNNSP